MPDNHHWSQHLEVQAAEFQVLLPYIEFMIGLVRKNPRGGRKGQREDGGERAGRKIVTKRESPYLL